MTRSLPTLLLAILCAVGSRAQESQPSSQPTNGSAARSRVDLAPRAVTAEVKVESNVFLAAAEYFVEKARSRKDFRGLVPWFRPIWWYPECLESECDISFETVRQHHLDVTNGHSLDVTKKMIRDTSSASFELSVVDIPDGSSLVLWSLKEEIDRIMTRDLGKDGTKEPRSMRPPRPEISLSMPAFSEAHRTAVMRFMMGMGRSIEWGYIILCFDEAAGWYVSLCQVHGFS